MKNPEPFDRIVGVDGGEKTGLAVWLPHAKEFESVETTDFWGAFFRILVFDCDKTAVVIEDPHANRPVFHRSGVEGKRAMKVAQNVGGVKRESRLLADGLRHMGYHVELVRPGSSKWDAATFRSLTRHVGRTSQHARDAGKLVFGLSPNSFTRKP